MELAQRTFDIELHTLCTAIAEWKCHRVWCVRRSEAHKNVPSPPFCFIKGCISGPGNRVRLEALRDQLGWNSLEPDDEKKWVPILMH